VEDLGVLENCARKMIGNPGGHTLEVLLRTEKSCERNGLSSLAESLRVVIGEIKKLRKGSVEKLKKLLEKGLEVDSLVCCKKCSKRCKTNVVAILPDEGLVRLDCYKSEDSGSIVVLPSNIRLLN
jgi:hypothetical protein